MKNSGAVLGKRSRFMRQLHREVFGTVHTEQVATSSQVVWCMKHHVRGGETQRQLLLSVRWKALRTIATEVSVVNNKHMTSLTTDIKLEFSG